MPITTEGLDVVRDRIANKIKTRLPIALNFVVTQISDDLVVEAKKEVGKDTGALDRSIHKNLIERSLDKVEMDVIAGDPNVLRGDYSNKQKRHQKPIPTTEYAAAHENYKGFMASAFQDTKGRIKQTIKEAFDKVFGV